MQEPGEYRDIRLLREIEENASSSLNRLTLDEQKALIAKSRSVRTIDDLQSLIYAVISKEPDSIYTKRQIYNKQRCEEFTHVITDEGEIGLKRIMNSPDSRSSLAAVIDDPTSDRDILLSSILKLHAGSEKSDNQIIDWSQGPYKMLIKTIKLQGVLKEFDENAVKSVSSL